MDQYKHKVTGSELALIIVSLLAGSASLLLVAWKVVEKLGVI